MRLKTGFFLFTVCAAFMQAAEVPLGTQLAGNQALRVDLGNRPEQIDPHFSSTAYENWILNDLFEPLLGADAEGHPCPGAAVHWEANENKTVWTFYLRPEACWSTGDPVTNMTSYTAASAGFSR